MFERRQHGGSLWNRGDTFQAYSDRRCGMTNSVEISVWRRSGRCIVDVGKDIK